MVARRTWHVRTAASATDGLLTIGEVARRSGFTVKALRFYERLGLLPPSGRRPSGYRLYNEADLHRLEFIGQAKALGLRLEAIRELVVAAREPGGAGARPRLLRMLEDRIAQTARQITMLTRLRRELERRRRALARGPYLEHSNGYCPCLERTVPPRATSGKVACRRARPSRRPTP
jgi:MerR family copper efflux transcriptional regulator